MKIVSTIKELRFLVDSLRLKGKIIGFAPTMGYLHRGHLSLVKRAKEENDFVIVSIYVNPAQFGREEDFFKYPRNLERDLDLLKKVKTDAVFLPDDKEMYGNKSKSKSQKSKLKVKSEKFFINPPRNLVDCLCGKNRPGHFEGVSLIVAKLFNIVKPDKAYFGQKDFQQTLVIKRLVEDLNFDVKIIVCPTAREKDGLAMSSRNVYLTEKERKVATILYKALVIAKKGIEQEIKNQRSKGKNESKKLKVSDLIIYCHNLIKSELLVKLEYFEIRDVFNLSKIKEIEKGQKIVIAGAIKIGKTRLIDNVVID